MKKRIVGAVCAWVLFFNIAIVYADAQIYENSNIQIFVDGQKGVYSVSPIVQNGRVLLPLREMLVNLGVANDDEHIVWNGQENSVTIVKESTSVYIKVGSPNATVNQSPIVLDVPPVNYQNRVYIPARFVAQSFGKKVEWDAATQSIYIGERTQAVVEQVEVSTVEAFIKALGSNKHIMMKAGTYNLSEIFASENLNNGVSWEYVFDGTELNFQNIDNLTIEGVAGETVEILTEPRHAEILNFTACSNISIKNITAGHTPQKYECEAGVLRFKRCTNVIIEKSDLYGCGSIGIEADQTRGLKCSDTVIHHCSWAPLYLLNSSDLEFDTVKLVESDAERSLVYAEETQNVVFKNCEIANNNQFEWSMIDVNSSYLTFENCSIYNNHYTEELGVLGENCFINMISEDAAVILRNCKVYNNSCRTQWRYPEGVTLENTTFENNTWESEATQNIDFDSTGKTELTFDQAKTRELNVFLSNFSEVFMSDFDSETIEKKELIYFGIFHNYFNNYAYFIEEPEDYSVKLSAQYVESTVLKYFNKTGVVHESIDDYGIRYDSGFYKILMGDGEDWPFTQVRHIYDNGSGEYLVEADVYGYSMGFEGEDPYKPDRYWAAGEVGESEVYAQSKAIVKKIKDSSGERYIILKYQIDYLD